MAAAARFDLGTEAEVGREQVRFGILITAM